MFSVVEKRKLKNAVERVLHVPGNYTGNVLEMTLVLDHKNEKEYIKEITKDIVSTLKSHSEVFRNVRLNVVQWIDDESIINEVTAMPLLLMGGYFDDYRKVDVDKDSDKLLNNLKLFHARSKLVILVSDFFDAGGREHFESVTRPFLGKKTILVKEGACYDLHRDL